MAGTQEAAESTETFADTAEESTERANIAWGRVADVTSAAMAATGGALEAYNRSQQETRDVSARVGNAIDETSQEVLSAAAEMNNATRSVGESIEVMEIGSQRGIESIEGLQDFAATWDTIGDATGESAAELASAAVSLEAVGVSAQEPTEAMAAFGFVSESTTATIGDFLKMTERVGRELGEESPHINEMAALFGAMEAKGLGAQQAQRELRQALRETNGDMEAALEILGITNATLAEYQAQVEASSDVIEENAQAVADNRTTLQELSADLESVAANYSGIGQAAEVAAPILLGSSIAIQGVRQSVRLLSGHVETLRSVSRGVRTGMGGLARFLTGPWGVAVGGAAIVVGELISAQREAAAATSMLRDELDGERADLDSLDDELLIAELRNKNLLSTLKDQGIELETVRQAVTGNDEAWGQLRVELDEHGNIYEGLLDVLPGVRSEKLELVAAIRAMRNGTEQYNDELAAERDLTDDTTGTLEEHNDALDANHRMNRNAAGALDEHDDALRDLESSLEDAKQEAKEFTTALERLTGPAINVEQAVLAWDDALSGLDETLMENEATLSRQSAEGRENRKAILDTVEAAQEHASAMIESGATTEEATATLNRHVDELRREMRQAGHSSEAIQDYIDKLNLTPDQIETVIEADSGPARGEVEGFTGDVTSMPAVPMDVGADTTPARQEIGDLRNWILSRGVIDMSMNLSGFEQGAGDGAMPPGGSVIDRLTGFMASTGVPHRVTSTLRPGDPGFHGVGRAVDFAGARPGIDTPNLRSIQEAFAPLAASGQLVELIGPNPALNFKRGRQGPGVYPADTREAHRNHVHTAMQLGGVIREPILGVGQSGATYSFGEAGDELITPMVNPVVGALSRGQTTSEGGDARLASPAGDTAGVLGGDAAGTVVKVTVEGDVLDPQDWFDRNRHNMAEAIAAAVEDAKARR